MELSVLVNNLTNLESSAFSLVIFDDEPQVWFLYNAGLLLGKKTIIIIKNTDYDAFIDRLNDKLVSAVIKVENFNDVNLMTTIGGELKTAIEKIQHEAK